MKSTVISKMSATLWMQF